MSAAILTRVGVRTGGLRSLLAQALQSLARQRAERRALAQLHAMSDRQLADVGLRRDQIDAAVRGVRGC